MSKVFKKFFSGSIVDNLILGFLVIILIIPIISIVFVAFSADENIWPHLISTVLPDYILTTMLILMGVSFLTFLIGTGLAWIITIYEFPFRKIFEWLCLLPLAMPTYIIAYSYGELLDYTGVVQSSLRQIFGWQTIQDYWFPNIFSTSGGIFLMSFVLYPYVFLTARAAFMRQSTTLIEASRTLGFSFNQSFTRIALPIARPGIVIGLILVMMECLNEFAAFEYFGINSLTVGVYVTWLEKGNLQGATQITLCIFLLIGFFIFLERKMRQNRSFSFKDTRLSSSRRLTLSKKGGYTFFIICFTPVFIGFVLPSWLLLSFVIERLNEIQFSNFVTLFFNSFILSAISSFVALIVALYLVISSSSSKNILTKATISISRLGYAFPGIILALGVIIVLSLIDKIIDQTSLLLFGSLSSIIISGGLIGVFYAYISRFLTVSYGTIDAGFSTLNSNLADASRILGMGKYETLKKVQIPIIKPAIIMAILLVFIDTMKELPATLILRPFNFDTLATNVYTYASLSDIQNAALPSLTIVIAGLLPVILINRELTKS